MTTDHAQPWAPIHARCGLRHLPFTPCPTDAKHVRRVAPADDGVRAPRPERPGRGAEPTSYEGADGP